MTSGARSRTSKSVSVVGALLLVGSALAIVAPAASGFETTGLWLIPFPRAADVIAGDDVSDIYVTGTDDPFNNNTFVGDAGNDSASVLVDLYNPTGADMVSVNLFVAINDADAFVSISFSGGIEGDSTIVAADLGGGSPATGVDPPGVYPAFFVSYGVGTVGAGASSIVRVWINASGDFAGGLILRVDYSGEDADENIAVGPYDAALSVFDNGETGPGECNEAEVDFSAEDGVGLLDFRNSAPGDATYGVNATNENGSDASNVTFSATFGSGIVLESATHGSIQGQTWFWNAGTLGDGESAEATITLSPGTFLIHGDIVVVDFEGTFDSCGVAHSVSASASPEFMTQASGDVHSAKWWKKQIHDAEEHKQRALYTEAEVEALLQAVALHSDVFAYGPWNGTDPLGGTDAGFVDIGSLDDAQDALKGIRNAPSSVDRAARQLLALWLNAADGAVNLDSALEVVNDCPAKKKKCETTFEKRTGLSALGDFDEVGAIIDNAESQLLDWKAGTGYSKAEMVLAAMLCKAVNREWVVLA